MLASLDLHLRQHYHFLTLGLLLKKIILEKELIKRKGTAINAGSAAI